MTNLLRKVFILILLSLIVVSVYLIKNETAREDVFVRLGLASSKDFKIPDNIKIDAEDIYVERIETEEESSYTEVVEEEEGIGSTSMEAWEERPEDLVVIAPKEISLEEIEEQIVQITKEVEKLQNQLKILVAVNEIQQEINNLAEEAEEMDLECPECNILSSV